jgi:hypothetical protein
MRPSANDAATIDLGMEAAIGARQADEEQDSAAGLERPIVAA